MDANVFNYIDIIIPYKTILKRWKVNKKGKDEKQKGDTPQTRHKREKSRTLFFIV